MHLTLHHVNLASDVTSEMHAFYTSVLGLTPAPELEDRRIGDLVTTDNKFVHDGKIQVHLSDRDAGLLFRSGHAVNPIDHGHVGFETDDIEAVKQQLREQEVPFADYGQWAMAGWYQIFFHDPAGNVVEVFQAMGADRP